MTTKSDTASTRPPNVPPTATPTGADLKRDGGRMGAAALQGALRQLTDVVDPDGPATTPARAGVAVARAGLKGALEHLVAHPESTVSQVIVDVEANTGAISAIGRALNAIGRK